MMNLYNFDEKPDRIGERCRKWDRKKIEEHFGAVPDDFIPLWIADMDFKIPETIADSFKTAIDRGVFGYTYVYDEFYDSVIKWQRDMHNAEVEKDWITLSYGTVSTIHYVIQAFCSEGDSVLMSTPVYEPFNGAADRQGVGCIYNTLKLIDNRYYIDFDMLEEQLREYRPKLYLFCSPHNPSGRIWSREELKRALKLCRQYGTILVVDEVHGDQIHYGGFTSILSLEKELQENVILLVSPNKAFNIGGLKTSYSIISNTDIRKAFRKNLAKNSITSPNVFGILGIIAAYNNSREWLKEVTHYIKENYEYVVKYIDEKMPELKVMKMEASYLPWINITGTGISSTELTEILAAKYGVLVEDGNNFVHDGEGWIRVNLGIQREYIVETMKRVEKCVREFGR